MDRQGRCVAVWHVDSQTTGPTTWSARSVDHGATWSAPFPIQPAHDGPISTLDSMRVATDGQGKWLLAVIRGETIFLASEPRLYLSRSSDAGTTWTSPEKMAIQVGYSPVKASRVHDPSGTSANLYRLLGTREGAWVLTYSWSQGGSGGMDYLVSEDDAGSWRRFVPPVPPLPPGTPADDVIQQQPDLAEVGPATWVACWRQEIHPFDATDLRYRGRQWFSFSGDRGRSWSAPVQVFQSYSWGQMAAGRGGQTLVTWDSGIVSMWDYNSPRFRTARISRDGTVTTQGADLLSGPPSNTRGVSPVLQSDGATTFMTVGSSQAPGGEDDLYSRTIIFPAAADGEWALAE